VVAEAPQLCTQCQELLMVIAATGVAVPPGGWLPSDLYMWDDMITAVHVMATEQSCGLAKVTTSTMGLSTCCFLGRCMQETIRYDACDENHWSDPATVQKYGGETYSSASACGQAHQSYQGYACTAEEDALAGGRVACEVDNNMMTRAHTQASWYGAPTKMCCAPKSVVPNAPRWDYMSPCGAFSQTMCPHAV